MSHSHSARKACTSARMTCRRKPQESCWASDAVIGYSTHNVAQAIAAATLPVDYIAIGPIFETGSKTNPDPVVGLDGLRAVREAIGEMPLVAIGGITEQNAKAVIDAGADSVALISGLLSGGPTAISDRCRTFTRILSP